MSYEVLIGYPEKRFLRASELIPYFQDETNRSRARASTLADLPPQVQTVAKELQQIWADEHGAGLAARTSGKTADYQFGTNSVFISFPDTQQRAASDEIIRLALDHELLYIDASRGSWLEARRPPGDHTPSTGFTAEHCLMKYVAFADLDELIAPGVFTDGSFLAVLVAQSHFLQVFAYGSDFIAEFKPGVDRPLYRTRFGGIGKVHALFKGYLEGKNMNNDTYRFGVAYTTSDSTLPQRDQFGLWRANPNPLIGRMSLSASLSQ